MKLPAMKIIATINRLSMNWRFGQTLVCRGVGAGIENVVVAAQGVLQNFLCVVGQAVHDTLERNLISGSRALQRVQCHRADF